MTGTKTPVVFIHGLWLHATSWQPWQELFAEAGYEPSAPGWPGDADTVQATRANPDSVANHGIDEVTTVPPWPSITSVTCRLCRSSASVMASGTVSHNRVDPSMSVSKNVTVPAGSSASPGSPGSAAAPVKLSLSSTARSSASSRSTSPRWRMPVGHAPGRPDAVDHRRQPGLPAGSGALEVKQHRLARGQSVLILQP